MLTLNLLKDENKVVYGKESDLMPVLSKYLKIPDLAERVRSFRAEPVKEGLTVRGERRSSVKLFIPDLYFGEHIDMGENVWLYLGEMDPAYCLYTPWGEEECGKDGD